MNQQKRVVVLCAQMFKRTRKIAGRLLIPFSHIGRGWGATSHGVRGFHGSPLPVELVAPESVAKMWPPVVFDSPHRWTLQGFSGRWYPPAAFWPVAAPLIALRSGEDAYLDELLRDPCKTTRVPLLLQNYPRCYVDVNRDPQDIDESLLAKPWPLGVRPTEKTKRGLGLIRRYVKPGVPIYDDKTKITTEQLMDRFQRVYYPYHGLLRTVLDRLVEHHGTVWHINWHSMKSRGNAMTPDGEVERPDFVVSNVDGKSAGAEFTDLVVGFLREKGYSVSINTPYKGGYIVSTYGAAGSNGKVQSLQIEIKRSLYLDEDTIKLKKEGCAVLRDDLLELCQLLVRRAPMVHPHNSPTP